MSLLRAIDAVGDAFDAIAVAGPQKPSPHR